MEGRVGLNIVLVEPEIPQNTGNIARTCAALGATLHLVHPLGFSLSEKHLRRAGLDYWPLLDLVEWRDSTSFFQETEGKARYYFSTKATQPYTAIAYPSECYLIFGKETTGLDADLLSGVADQAIRIPMKQGIRSLNLSNTVAIAAYEWERQHTFSGLQTEGALQLVGTKEHV